MPFESTVQWGQAVGGDRASRDEQRVRRGFWRKAGRVAARLPFAEDLLAAYFCAFDPATPFRVRGALAYFVLPFDFMPDLLPFLGFADDAAVLLGTLRMIAGNMLPEHRDAARAALERLKRRP